MGMICGGEVGILIHFVNACDATQNPIYQDIAAAMDASRQTCLLTRIPAESEAIDRPYHGPMGKVLRLLEISILP
jgi:hypothetical protein